MKNPCKPDCPRRSPTCHAECPDYAKFWEWGEQRRKARMAENEFIYSTRAKEAERKKLNRYKKEH